MKYLILHTPRTGSTYLCSLLHQTGIAGLVDIERCGFFVGMMDHIQPETLPDYLALQTTPNGVFGAKVGMYYLTKEMRTHPDLAWHILQDTDKFIWLRRRDKVAQAVSMHIAGHTKRWHSNSPAAVQKTPDPPYNRFRISSILADMAAEETRTIAMCDTLAIQPLTIWYEDLMDRPEVIIEQILDFLSIPYSVLPAFQTLYKKLENPNKMAYIDRYRRGE